MRRRFRVWGGEEPLTHEELKEKALLLPLLPGVYIMKDAQGAIIYIGKAKALKNRVSQYFANLASHTPKTVKMVSQINEFETIITGTEFEALLLECALIKKHKPKYNILLKDDKGYPFLRLSKEAYPRFSIVSKPAEDGARYFGPYAGRSGAKKALEAALQTFKLPDCSLQFPRDIGKRRPCLNAHIGRCCAVCSGEVSQQEYNRLIGQMCSLLDGKYQGLVDDLEKEMEQAAEEMLFERAAALRDRMRAVQRLGKSQLIFSGALSDLDVIACDFRGSRACVVILNYIGGNLLDKKKEFFDGASEEDAGDIIEGFIKQYYAMTQRSPRVVLTSHELEDWETLAQWLAMLRRGKVYLQQPQRGEKRKQMELALENARQELELLEKREQKTAKSLELLAQILGLPQPPSRVEAYDISNLAGADAVASMTVLKDGRFARSAYRRFKIKEAQGGDDYGSMAETLRRRLDRAAEGDQSFLPLPDLMLIDGGQGQVNAVLEQMEGRGLDIPVFGMVKDDRHRTRALVDGQGREFGIRTLPAVFALVGNLQEETHRFAIEYQKSLRSKSVKGSVLANIPGVGEQRIRALRRKFGSMAAIRQASEEQLAAVTNKTVARQIRLYFDGQESPGEQPEAKAREEEML